MTIEPHRNLTITLLRRNQFSTLRLRGGAPRRVVRPRHVHTADRARLAPAVENCRRGHRFEPATRLDGWPHEDSWPYDGQSAGAPLEGYAPSGAATAPAVDLGGRLDLWA